MPRWEDNRVVYEKKVCVQLTASQFNWIKEKLSTSNMKVSEYIRDLVDKDRKVNIVNRGGILRRS